MKYYIDKTPENMFAFEDTDTNIPEHLIPFNGDLNNGLPYSDYLEADINGFHAKNDVKLQEKAEVALIARYKGYYLEEVSAKLKELDYDSIATVKLWEGDAMFGAEATKILNWYKAIIAKNYEILNAVKNQTRAIPTKEEYLAELPAYV